MSLKEYSRWLPDPAALRIGFFREEARVDEVPAEPHDQRLDFIVTPSRIIACPPRGKAG